MIFRVMVHISRLRRLLDQAKGAGGGGIHHDRGHRAVIECRAGGGRQEHMSLEPGQDRLAVRVIRQRIEKGNFESAGLYGFKIGLMLFAQQIILWRFGVDGRRESLGECIRFIYLQGYRTKQPDQTGLRGKTAHRQSVYEIERNDLYDAAFFRARDPGGYALAFRNPRKLPA